jgi:hypothetical protein
MIAKGAPAISTLADIITKVLDLDSALSNLGQGGAFEGFFGTIADNVKGAAGAFVDMKDRAAEVIKYGPFSTTEQQKQQDWADHIKNLVVPSIDDLDRAHKNLAHGGMSDVEYQEDQNIAKAATYAEQVDKTQREVTSDINAMKAKWDELNGNITKEKALINYRQEVADTKQAMEDAGKAAKEHGVGSPEHVAALENARLKQLDLEQSTVDLAQKYTDLPPTVLTDVKAVIDAGSLDLLPETIQAAIDRKDYRVKAHLDTIVIDGETHAAGSTTIKVSNTPGGQFVRQFATGGVVPGPIGAPVPAIVHGGEEVIPVGGRSLSTPVTIINNFPPGVDPQSVALAQRKYFRRGGR